MSLTLGTGPFGQSPAGTFNFEPEAPDGHAIYLERSPREVRGELRGEVVVRSRRVRMLHETGRLPVYYFPVEDVRMDLLEPSSRSSRCPWKGEATYWTVRVGEHKAEDAAWRYPRPERAPADLAGLLAFDFAAMDAWYEEEERIGPHPRDPYHRVDVRRSGRHVVVSAGGRTVAETRRPWALFETGLPMRLYVPREDVHMDVLEPTDTVTRCPYKGRASYFRLAGADGPDIAWSYEEPLAEALPVAGALCFYDDRVDVAADA